MFSSVTEYMSHLLLTFHGDLKLPILPSNRPVRDFEHFQDSRDFLIEFTYDSVCGYSTKHFFLIREHHIELPSRLAWNPYFEHHSQPLNWS